MVIRERTDADLDPCVEMAHAVHELDGYPPYLPTDLRTFLVSPDAYGAWVAETLRRDRRPRRSPPAQHRRRSWPMASDAVRQPAERLGSWPACWVAPAGRRRGVGQALLDVARATPSAGGCGRPRCRHPTPRGDPSVRELWLDPGRRGDREFRKRGSRSTSSSTSHRARRRSNRRRGGDTRSRHSRALGDPDVERPMRRTRDQPADAPWRAPRRHRKLGEGRTGCSHPGVQVRLRPTPEGRLVAVGRNQRDLERHDGVSPQHFDQAVGWGEAGPFDSAEHGKVLRHYPQFPVVVRIQVNTICRRPTRRISRSPEPGPTSGARS